MTRTSQAFVYLLYTWHVRDLRVRENFSSLFMGFNKFVLPAASFSFAPKGFYDFF